MARPLTDDEASKEMKKMVAFIMQEATEKAREIQVKADEEFNIEKAKLVRQETASIEASFARKLKQADVRRKIAQSNHLNKARLQVLQARDQALEEIFGEVHQRLDVLTSNTAAYEQLLEKLVLESMYRLMDSEIVLQCRMADVEMVERAIAKASPEFSKSTSMAINAKVNRNNPLPEASKGGIVASAKQGRIRCVNTLEARLDLACTLSLPSVRNILFGPSETRVFFD